MGKAASDRTAAANKAQMEAGGGDPRQAMLAELTRKAKSGDLKDGFSHISKADRNKPKGEKVVNKYNKGPKKFSSSNKPKVQRAEVNTRVSFDQLKLAYCVGKSDQKE